MIDDPIVIRKSKGNLIVSSSKPTDPIQLVRQLSTTSLEVHLKNGNRYIEEVDADEVQEVILEMMGYSILQLQFSFHTWPKDQTGTLHFLDEDDELEIASHRFLSNVFAETPYMNSKFISASIDVLENGDIEYYDTTYSSYDVTVSIKFRHRMDEKNKVAEYVEKHGRDMYEIFLFDRSLANSFEAVVFDEET